MVGYKFKQKYHRTDHFCCFVFFHLLLLLHHLNETPHMIHPTKVFSWVDWSMTSQNQYLLMVKQTIQGPNKKNEIAQNIQEDDFLACKH